MCGGCVSAAGCVPLYSICMCVCVFMFNSLIHIINYTKHASPSLSLSPHLENIFLVLRVYTPVIAIYLP